MTHRWMLVLIVSLGSAVCAVAPGCESAQKAESMLNAAKDIVGKWNLQELMGEAVKLPGGGETPNLSIANDGQVSGFGGVNRFASSLDMDKLLKGDFSLSPAASTKMAGPPEAMKLEDSFLKALTDATGFDLSGNTLTLKNGAQTLMKFIKG